MYGHIIFVGPRADGQCAGDLLRPITDSELIPEHRVVAQSKAIFDDRTIDTRETSSDSSIKLKRQLAAKGITLGK